MDLTPIWILGPPLGLVTSRMAYYLLLGALGKSRPVDEHMLQRGGETLLLGQTVRQAFAFAVKPIATTFERLKFTPNTLTMLCFVVCATAGVFVGLGELALGGAIGIIGAALDYFDGDLARRSGTASTAGSFLDSTLDRYGEIAFFAGAACFFRHNVWLLLASLITLGSGTMVSYTRAKAEAFGYQLRGGLMQRSERIVVFCAGAFFGPYCDSLLPPQWQGRSAIFAAVIVLLAVFTTQTAIVRTINGFRGLQT